MEREFPDHQWKKVRDKWVRYLTVMLCDYRQKSPGDPRSDKELLDSLIDHFVASGLVRKKDGKYLLPDIVEGDKALNPFLKMMH